MQRQPDAPGEDRDPFTAQYWNGRVQVVIYPPLANSALPPVPELARALFGTGIAEATWAALVGAPDGAVIEVLVDSSDAGPAIQLRLHHPWLVGPAIRYVYRDRDGRVAVRNVYLQVDDAAPPGIATRILAHQVAAAKMLGVDYLTAEAAGGPASPLIGYFVWARLGYTGPIPDRVRQRLPAVYRDAVDVLDLVTRPGGAEWWRRYGQAFEATFDLREGSRSLDALTAYTLRQGIRL